MSSALKKFNLAYSNTSRSGSGLAYEPVFMYRAVITDILPPIVKELEGKISDILPPIVAKLEEKITKLQKKLDHILDEMQWHPNAISRGTAHPELQAAAAASRGGQRTRRRRN